MKPDGRTRKRRPTGDGLATSPTLEPQTTFKPIIARDPNDAAMLQINRNTLTVQKQPIGANPRGRPTNQPTEGPESPT